MRIAEAWRLVGPKFKQHRKRVILTVIPMSFLFGIAIMCCLLTPCFEQTLLNAMSSSGNGKIYLSAGMRSVGEIDEDEIAERMQKLYDESDDPEKKYPFAKVDALTGEVFDEPVPDRASSFYQAAVEEIARERSEELRTYIKQQVADTGAKVLDGGLTTRVGSSKLALWGGSYSRNGDSASSLVMFFDEELTKSYVQTDYADDEIPVIVNFDTAARALGKRSFSGFLTIKERETLIDEVLSEGIGKQLEVDFCDYEFDEYGMLVDESLNCDEKAHFKIVGIIPSAMSYETSNGAAFVDPIFNSFSNISGLYHNFILAEATTEARKFYDFDEAKLANIGAASVLEFDSYADAAKMLAESERCDLSGQGNCLNLVDVNGAYAMTHLLMGVETAIFRTIYLFLSVLAVVVMVISMRKVILDEGELITLYRALGASKKDVRRIYGVYIARMTMKVIVWSLIIGLVLTAGIMLIEQPGYMTLVSAGFATKERFRYMSVGFSVDVLAVLACIVLAGMISYAFAAGKLARRYLRDK